MTLPCGKGMWIWKVQRCGEPALIAQQAVDAGLSHVLVKLCDGVDIYYGGNNYYDHSRDWSLELVHALKSAGITVLNWQYCYGYDPAREANVAVQRLRQAGLTIHVIDAEKEYKVAGMGAKAVQYCQWLKQLMPEIVLGLSTYRYPTYHREFPFAEFGQFMDFYMPQVYWQGAHNPSEQLGRCLREYAALPYPNKPVYPAGAAYKEGGWQPDPGEVTTFLSASKNIYEIETANLWEWYDSKVVLLYTWNEMRAFDYGKPPKTQLEILWREANAHPPAGWNLNP
jgi:hypothetical protein